MGFWIKHFAVGGFFESALRSWWIFIRRSRFILCSNAKKIFLHMKTKNNFFLVVRIFFLPTRNFSLPQEKNSCAKKFILAARKNRFVFILRKFSCHHVIFTVRTWVLRHALEYSLTNSFLVPNMRLGNNTYDWNMPMSLEYVWAYSMLGLRLCTNLKIPASQKKRGGVNR